MGQITIRPARAGEDAALSALAKRSKAHWGYDAAFMALSDAALTVAPAPIAQGWVLVAVAADDAPLGLAALAPMAEDGVWDLAHMFVAPEAMGLGAGRLLFDAIARLARARGATRLSILADPNAEAFYLRMGARRIGDAPSDAVPGRRLPLLVFDLPRV